MASALFEQRREENGSTCIWTVDIFFPAFEDIEEKRFSFSTEKLTLFDEALAEDIDYRALLAEYPRLRNQSDRGNDYGECSIQNKQNEIYDEFSTWEDLVESAEVTVKECYEIEPGYFESEVSFFGYVKDFSVDETDKTLKFTFYADTSRPNFLVGGRILTRERCGAPFNYLGLKSADAPDYHLCGWQTAQGGNPLFCSHYLEGVDGCIAHNNEHRFYAVPALKTAPIISTGNGIGGGGNGDFDPPPNGCFTRFMFVPMWDGTFKPIDEVMAGEDVFGFDIETDEIRSSRVVASLVHKTHLLELLYFKRGAVIETTKIHPFYVGNSEFINAEFLAQETVKAINPKKNWLDDLCERTKEHRERTLVYNFQTETETYFVTDRFKMVWYAVHNKIIGPEGIEL